MDYLKGMNNALDYIESNLDGEIDYYTVAKLACCSINCFQRMFSYIADIHLSEYIRRRRMTLAAFELQNSNAKVIDLAIKYGYESPDSFSRAFQNVHGIIPSMARNVGMSLKAYPRITFHISIKGDVEMNYRIEKKEAFRIIIPESTWAIFEVKGPVNIAIADAWKRIFSEWLPTSITKYKLFKQGEFAI